MRVGRYTLKRTVQIGGQGCVKEGTDERGERVAIKVLQKSSTPAGRIVNEICAMSSLQSHPHIVTFRSEVATRDEVYVVMDFVPGEELLARLRRSRTLPEATARRLCMQIVDAVAFAHAAGWAHRDLKLENVIVSPDDACATLLDFGFAVRERYPTECAGSVGYCAPELRGVQERSVQYDTFAADVFSAGVVLFAMLTGRLPFRPGQESANLFIPSSVSPQAAQLLKLMLCADPARRPSAADVLRHPWFGDSDPSADAAAAKLRAAATMAGGAQHAATERPNGPKSPKANAKTQAGACRAVAASSDPSAAESSALAWITCAA